jgi:hypothetical protein
MYIVTFRWMFGTVITCAMLLALYGVYAVYSIPRGGGFTGYALGIIGTLFIFVLMLLPIRKRQYQRPVGRLDVWMRMHVCLGIITGVIVGMHAGFRVGGTISIMLTVLFVLVLLSGIIGTVLYELLPHTIARMGNQMFRAESLLENRVEVERALDTLQTDRSAQFRDMVTREFTRRRYPTSITPLILFPWLIRFAGNNRDVETRVKTLPEAEQIAYQNARKLLTQHWQLDRQLFYQQVLKQWLWTHIPLSAAMITLLIVHIVSELYY